MCRNRCTVCFTSLLHNYSSLPLYHWRRYDWLVASLLPELGSNLPTGWWHGEGEICGVCSRRHRKYEGYYVLGDGGRNVNRLHHFTISTPFCAYLPVIFCWLVMLAMLLMLPVRFFCLQHILYRYLYTTALARATPLNRARPEPVHLEGSAHGQKRERMGAWL